ncbi:MAG: phosphotransferase family protein [Anaerolineales bacterium]|nr:phosphotransferase family protein [Anaerolineales bacterium]
MTNSDVIPVRPDEQLNEINLTAYLADKRDLLGVGDQPFTVRQFGGGMANLTYLLDFGDRELVLRRPPLGPVAKSAHDMHREYTVLSRLWQAFPYAPRAYLYCDDPSVIGADFFIMERRNGVVVRRRIPPQFQGMSDAPRQMSLALVDALADFHAVDYAAIGLGDLGQPDGFLVRQVEGWYKRWNKAKHTEIPEMDAVYQWLRGHIPPSSGASLVHNDYKLDNVMLAEDDPGQMVAIFDWDMCTLGDPLSDVGALLTYWTDDTDPPYLQMVASSFMPIGQGFMTRPELLARYAEKSGRDLTHINFYHALGLFRLTVILAQIYIRYVRGQTKDQRFAPLGELMPLLAKAAVETMNNE